MGKGDKMPTFERFVLQGSPFVRLAGLSGAAAVALGAYGAHCKFIKAYEQLQYLGFVAHYWCGYLQFPYLPAVQASKLSFLDRIAT